MKWVRFSSKAKRIVEVTVNYFMWNSMEQPVKLFWVLSADATGKLKNIYLFYRREVLIKEIEQTATTFNGLHSQNICAG